MNKNVVERYDYYPFGLVSRSSVSSDIETVQKFTGKELEDEHGVELYYFGARYYDPVTGRFVGVCISRPYRAKIHGDLDTRGVAPGCYLSSLQDGQDMICPVGPAEPNLCSAIDYTYLASATRRTPCISLDKSIYCKNKVGPIGT